MFDDLDGNIVTAATGEEDDDDDLLDLMDEASK
jgi:hypothetical protein